MFRPVQEQLLTDRVSCHSPKWGTCDGIDLANGEALGIAVRAGLRWEAHGKNSIADHRKISVFVRELYCRGSGQSDLGPE